MARALHIDVATASRAYQIHVGQELIPRLGRLIKKAGGRDRCFVVSSPPIWKFHGQAVKAALKSGKGVDKAFSALEKAIVKNEDALRMFANL